MDDDDWDQFGWHKIHLAASSYNVQALKLMLDRKTDPELRTLDFGETPLDVWARSISGGFHAARQCLRLLIDAKADANCGTDNVLASAVTFGSPMAVTLLLEHKTFVDKNGQLLTLAFMNRVMSNRLTTITEMLLEHGVAFCPESITRINLFEENNSRYDDDSKIPVELCRKEYKFRACEFGFDSM